MTSERGGFYLMREKARLTKATSQRAHSDDNDRTQLRNGLTLVLDVDPHSCGALDYLFGSGIGALAHGVDADGVGVVTLSSSTSVDPLTLHILEGSGQREVFSFVNVPVKGAAKLKLTGTAALLELSLDARLSRDDLASLHEYLGADLYVDAQESQPSLLPPDEVASGMQPDDLKGARAALGLSREEMSKALGISPKSLQRYEGGERLIPLGLAERVQAIIEGGVAL